MKHIFLIIAFVLLAAFISDFALAVFTDYVELPWMLRIFGDSMACLLWSGVIALTMLGMAVQGDM